MASKIRFLTLDEVLEIHAYQTRTFGGDPGLRDSGLLESAIEAPKATFGRKFLYANIFEMAGAYLVGIVRNHPFIDGNKRTGAMAAAIFLELNGIDFCANEDDFASIVLLVAQGKISAADVANFFRKTSK